MNDLGGFLQSRRARISPESVGLRSGSRRRVAGLRREELAQLAGISVEYYQRLEQGRASHPSDEVLDAICTALSLSAVERDHVRALARPPRRSPRPAASTARPELHRMLTLVKAPAIIVNDRFDVLALNPIAQLLFVSASGSRNLARFLFLDPAARDFYVEWDDAAATAGQLRTIAAQFPQDSELTALLHDLRTSSAAFRSLWQSEDVEIRTHGAKSFRHAAVGVLTFNYENFTLAGDPRQRLVTFSPEPDSPTEAALHLLTTWSDSRPAYDELQPR
jgi:transcriptional regulator with XRE-family HTH domain